MANISKSVANKARKKAAKATVRHSVRGVAPGVESDRVEVRRLEPS